jgi:hypothetical protein
MSMAFRTHIGRPFDPRLRSNQLLAVLVIGSGLLALFDGAGLRSLLPPAHGFLIWALLREIDPDHSWTALGGGAGAATWALLGGEVTSGLAILGLMAAARLVTGTTGRRLLPLDLAGLTVLGIAIGFTVEGWVAGFGLAIAIYLDDRITGRNRGMQVAASAVTAVGTTVMATAAGVLPETIPDVVPHLAVFAGVASLVLVLREPAEPTTTVDARHGAFLDRSRLYSSRSLIGVLVFAATCLAGSQGVALTPVIGALALAIASNEVESIRRRRR